MNRGDSPSISLKISGYKVEDMSTIHLTFRQDKIVLTKTEDELVLNTYYNTITCNLSQMETLMFANGVVEMQLRITTIYDDAWSGKIYEIDMGRVLEEGVI